MIHDINDTSNAGTKSDIAHGDKENYLLNNKYQMKNIYLVAHGGLDYTHDMVKFIRMNVHHLLIELLHYKGKINRPSVFIDNK